ncbi:MAG TPA: hypothetical protein VKB56_00040 [Terriglobales bacterium]|nr:hypothetical protein [Terriglobales bacterium]
MAKLFCHRLKQRKLATLFLALAVTIWLAACGSTGSNGSKSLLGSVGAASPAAPAAANTTQGNSVSAQANTLSAMTGANTSAGPSFASQTNGNVGGANISKVPTNTLLTSGTHTPIYAHLMGWFGTSSHMNVGYTSSDPAQIHRQVADALSRGISGFVLDWYGQNADPMVNNTLLGLKTEAENQAGSFSFAVMYDGGALTSCHSSACDLNKQTISDLTYAYNTVEQSKAYIRLGGRPVVLFFDADRYGTLDWALIQASVPGNPVFLFNGAAFTHAGNGAYSWVVPSSNAADWQSSLDSFYSQAQTFSSEFAMGATYKGFNDSMALWGTGRLMNQACGSTWLGTFTEANKYVSTETAGLQIVTWNDYEEGTEIETGIDNCVAISASLSKTTLAWTITGSESTVDHYTVFASSDGQNLTALGDVPAGTHSYDLSSANLAAGNHTIYVQAVGKPSLTNKMSAGVQYSS